MTAATTATYQEPRKCQDTHERCRKNEQKQQQLLQLDIAVKPSLASAFRNLIGPTFVWQ